MTTIVKLSVTVSQELRRDLADSSWNEIFVAQEENETTAQQDKDTAIRRQLVCNSLRIRYDGACNNARELFLLQAVDAFSLQPRGKIEEESRPIPNNPQLLEGTWSGARHFHTHKT